MEFFEDLIDNSPESVEKIKLEEAKEKNIQYITGDSVIDELEASLAKGEEIPDNINELLLGKENAARYQAWLEAKQVYDSSPASGGFSADPEMLEEVEERLEKPASLVPFFTSEEEDGN